MSANDCGFCDGSRTIRLAERCRPVAPTEEPSFEPPGVAVRTFPCPACGDVAPFSRVWFAATQFEAHEAIPEHVLYRQAAASLTQEVLKGGGISVREVKAADWTGRKEYRATMSVVMPRDVASFEARVAERQSEVAARVVSAAAAKIANQGVQIGMTMIDKDTAFRLLDEALRETRADA